MQETFNWRHPVSVTCRRIKAFVGHGHSSSEGTHQEQQVNTKQLNMREKVLLSHSRGSCRWGCCQKPLLQGSPMWSVWAQGGKWPASPRSSPTVRDNNDLLSQIRKSSFVKFHSAWNRLGSGSCLRHHEQQIPRGEHEIKQSIREWSPGFPFCLQQLQIQTR